MQFKNFKNSAYDMYVFINSSSNYVLAEKKKDWVLYVYGQSSSETNVKIIYNTAEIMKALNELSFNECYELLKKNNNEVEAQFVKNNIQIFCENGKEFVKFVNKKNITDKINYLLTRGKTCIPYEKFLNWETCVNIIKRTPYYAVCLETALEIIFALANGISVKDAYDYLNKTISSKTIKDYVINLVLDFSTKATQFKNYVDSKVEKNIEK